MNCPKCHSNNLCIVQSGPHNNLICSECFAFVKFLSDKDADTFEQINKQKQLTKKVEEYEIALTQIKAMQDFILIHEGPGQDGLPNITRRNIPSFAAKIAEHVLMKHKVNN